MDLNNAIRRAAPRVVPLAIRASAGSLRYLHHGQGAAFSAAAKKPSRNYFPGGFPSIIHQYSTKHIPECSLLRDINYEIEYCVENRDEDEFEVPEGLPFKIEDQPGQQTVTLSREYNGENITVEVHMPLRGGGENEKDNDDEEEGEQAIQFYIPLVVRISKSSGHSLEFGCTAYPDEIAIDTLSTKDLNSSDDQMANEERDFAEFEEDLQKSLNKYLEIRGIEPSTTNFLFKYMINKDRRLYLACMENLQMFVQA